MADYQGKLTGAQIDALPGELEKKQGRLYVTLLNNGNVRIDFGAGITQDFMSAAPSGDPMHYAYIAVGATWNASTMRWGLLDIDDLSNEDMRRIYNVGFLKLPLYGALGGEDYAKIRVNLCRLSSSNVQDTSLMFFAYNNKSIESINLTNRNALGNINSYEGIVTVTEAYQAFLGCTNLRCIYGRLQLNGRVTEVFKGCSALERVRLYKLDRSISFEDSPNIDKESLLYAINQSTATSSIVITLHANAYARHASDAEVKAALANKTLVTLASA